MADFETKRIINLPAESAPESGDVFAVDNESNGTKKLAVSYFTQELNKRIAKPEQNPNGEAGQTLRSNGDGTTDWGDAGLPTDEQTQTAVNEWLAGHPEATTTVQDGSITEVKLANALKLKTIKDYVTPEMFGAVGDGVTDDTQAWQSAVNVGVDVVATKELYKCGKITVTKNITIDCNGADFLCLDTTLFDCTGYVTATLTGENDYVANQSGYAISNAEHATYTGFAMMRGTNNFVPSRDYYRGGFVCWFKSGKCLSQYPIDVTGVAIDLVTPIIVKITKIGNITHTSNADPTFSLKITYGLDCVLSDINGDSYASYSVITFEKCINCYAQLLNIVNDFSSSNDNSYIVMFEDSAYCTLRDATLKNVRWHCATTGGIYLCYGNSVINCELYTLDQYAYLDHPNGFGTRIINSVLSWAEVNGLCYVRNVRICSTGSASRNVQLSIAATPIERCAVYDIADVEFDMDETLSNSSSNGIAILAQAGQVAGVTRYIKTCHIKNVRTNGTKNIYFTLRTTNTEPLVLKDIVLDDFNGTIQASKESTQTHIDISNFVMTLKNITCKKTFGTSTVAIYNVVVVDNCMFDTFRGVLSELYFNRLQVTKNMNGITVSGKLVGDVLIGYIPDAQLFVPTRLSIGMMSVNDSYTYYNITNTQNGNKYRQAYDNNGNVVVTQIAQ